MVVDRRDISQREIVRKHVTQASPVPTDDDFSRDGMATGLNAFRDPLLGKLRRGQPKKYQCDPPSQFLAAICRKWMM